MSSTDTMALVLHLEHRRSTPKVQQIFEQADSGESTVHIPAIVFAEILYLSEKQRISLTPKQLRSHLAGHDNYVEIPLSLEVVQCAERILDIPELHDRLIAATASFLDLEVITNDPKIQASASVVSIW